MAPTTAPVATPKHTKTTFEKIIKIAADSKVSWTNVNLEEADEVVQCLTAECDADWNYFMKPRFVDVLEAVVTIIKGVAEIPNKSTGLNKFCNTMFLLLSVLLKEDNVRITLRDSHNLFLIVSRFFDASLPESGVVVVLSVLVLTSRNVVIDWKPPQLVLLLKNLNTYILEHPRPSLSLALALQLLVNICQENPSFSLIGKFDGTHKKVGEVLRGFWNRPNQNKTHYLLATHMMFHYEPMLPVEAVNAGCPIITTLTTQAITNYRLDNGMIDDLGPTFLQLKDFVTTFTRKLEPFFTNTESTESDPQISKMLIEIKDIFVKTSIDVLRALKPFIITVTKQASRKLDSRVMEELLQYVITLMPSFISMTHQLESCKAALGLIKILLETAEKGSRIYTGCLSVYLHVLEITVEQDRKSLDTTLGTQLMEKLCVSSDVSPKGVDLNTVSVRLLNLLSTTVNAEDVRKKLDLGILRTLVGGLVDPEDILPTIKKRRTNCLLEVLSTMSKFSRYAEVLDQLLSFVKTDTISQQLAICILNGDERVILTAFALTTVVSFDFDAISRISKSIIKVKSSWDTMDASIGEMMTPIATTSKSSLCLEHALKSLPSPVIIMNGIADTPLDDIVTWYNLKLELHNHELNSANQNIQQLHETIERLKGLMEKQFHVVCRQAVENDNTKMEMVSLQNSFVCRQKNYVAKTTALEQETASLKSELEEGRVKGAELLGKLDREKTEKEALAKKLEAEEKSRTEAIEKYRSLRDTNRTQKNELTQIQGQLDDKDKEITKLKTALREKEEESNRNRILFETERRRLDAIRSVVGPNFGNGLAN